MNSHEFHEFSFELKYEEENRSFRRDFYRMCQNVCDLKKYFCAKKTFGQKKKAGVVRNLG